MNFNFIGMTWMTLYLLELRFEAIQLFQGELGDFRFPATPPRAGGGVGKPYASRLKVAPGIIQDRRRSRS